MNRWLTLGLVLVAVAALLLRWPKAEQRPMHNDEAVNGLKFGQLWEGKGYRYDPNEHHGPTLYYLSVAALKCVGSPARLAEISENRLRWVTVLFGVSLIALLTPLKDGLGRGGIWWTAVFTATSPAFVFYSVYYIHEMLLVFFALGTLACAWRYWRTRKLTWALFSGAFLGLMAATKETFVISIAAAGIAVVVNQIWNRFLDASEVPQRAPALNLKHMGLAAAAALGTGILVFSSFLTNAQGPLDAIRTYQPWLARAGGESPHLHPWHFYVERLLWFNPPKGPLWTEGLILILATVGAWAGFSRKGVGDARASLLRFLAIYSLALAGMYAFIWYKTPWCLLNFWHGFILLAGFGASWLVRNTPKGWRQAAVAGAILAGSAHLGYQAYRSLNVLGAARENPYVYAQTRPDVLRLVNRVKEIAAREDGDGTLIKVVCPESDYWPLPWYLRNFNRVGWWDQLPEDPYAPMMIVSAGLDARLDENRTHLMVGLFELRPAVFLELYVELELWKKVLANSHVQTVH